MTRRRWIADQWNESTASMRGEQAEHLIRVLRAEEGMEFDVVAGEKVWRAGIVGISGDQVIFRLISEVEAEAALPVTLLISIFKFDRMEWIIEKATELGVERMTPIVARRSGKHLVHAAPARVERWRRIAREAAKQSRRSDVPAVSEVVPLKTAARSWNNFPGAAAPMLLLLSEQERSATLASVLMAAAAGRAAQGAQNVGKLAVVMAVGPEGGWAAEEEVSFAAEGWRPVSLGPRILRAETAAITAMAVVAALL